MNTLSILFWLHPTRRKNLYLRITVNGQRAEISTGKQIDPEQWKGHGIFLDSSVRENRIKNRRFREIIDQVESIFDTLEEKNLHITANLIKDLFLGVRTMPGERKQITITEAETYFKESNWKQTGDEWKRISLRNWTNFCEFIHKNFSEPFFFDALRKKHVIKFCEHLEEQGFKHAYRRQCFSGIKNVIETISEVCNEEVLVPEADPTKGIRIKITDKEKDAHEDNVAKYLPLDEFNKFRDHKFTSRMKSYVQKLFLLQCYTGMANRELRNFNPESHLITSIGDKQQKLQLSRRKTLRSTGVLSEIPVFDETAELIDYFIQAHDVYKGRHKNKFLYVPKSLNDVLDQMAKELEIRHISSHTGRHTFGYLMLLKGFSIQEVSVMLGHSSITTTENFYPRVNFDHIKKAMNQFSNMSVFS